MDRLGKGLGCGLLVAAVLGGTLGDAKKAEAQVRKVRPGSALQGRLDRQVRLTNGRTVSVREVMDKLDGASRSDRGRSAQDAMDRLEKNAAQLRRLSSDSPLLPSTVLAAPRSLEDKDDGKLDLDLSGLGKVFKPVNATKEISKELGDRNWASAYASFGFRAQAPDPTRVSCSADFRAGAYLRGQHYPLVKFLASYGAVRGKPASAKVELYVKGDKVFSEDENLTSKNIFPQQTFAPDVIDVSKQIIEGLTAKGKLEVSATLGIRPTLKAISNPTTVECAMGVEPFLESKVKGSASVKVEYAGFEGEAGINASLKNKARLPLEVGLAIGNNPPIVKGRVRAGADIELMTGHITAYYRLEDECWGFEGAKICLSDIAGVLDIPLRGTKSIWSSGMEWKPKPPANTWELIECVTGGITAQDADGWWGYPKCNLKARAKPGWEYEKTWFNETFPK